MPSRPYELGRRAAAMDERRARIIASAHKELLGGRRFTLDAVAERAAVSRMTVYALFGDRDALLEAVYDDLAASGGLLRIPDAFAASDRATALETLVTIFCHFYTVHRSVIRRLHALEVVGTGDPGGLGARNARRRHILGALLHRSGVDDERLLDTLQALTGFAFIDELAGPERKPDDVAGEVANLVRLAVADRMPGGSTDRHTGQISESETVSETV
jgi:AcrR family transcriptional regulator